MTKQEEKSDILVAAKPIMALAMLVVWPISMHIRSQTYADSELAELAALIASWINPVPLALATVVFIAFAIITPWPSLRAAVAALATAAVALVLGGVAFAFAPSGFVSLVLIGLVIGVTPKLHSVLLRVWPSINQGGTSL